MILIAISFHASKGKLIAGGEGKSFGATPFQSKESTLFDINMPLQTGSFRSFAGKGKGPDPQDPLVARLHIVLLGFTMRCWSLLTPSRMLTTQM